MTILTPELIADLRKKADAAAQAVGGEWEVGLEVQPASTEVRSLGFEGAKNVYIGEMVRFREDVLAPYVAAACPDVVIALLDKIESLERQIEELRSAVSPLLGIPYDIDDATVPVDGPNSAPDQVVGTLHISLAKMRRIQAALHEAARAKVIRQS